MRRTVLLALALAVLSAAGPATAYTIDRAVGVYTFGRDTPEGFESGYLEFEPDHAFALVVDTDTDRDGIANSYSVTRGEYFVKLSDEGEPGIFVVLDGEEGVFLSDPRSDGERIQSFCVFDRCFNRKPERLGYFDAKGFAASVGSGSLYIETDPAGAIVFVDGERKPGNTPLTVTDISAGIRHSIRIEHTDHAPLVRIVTLQPGREQRLVAKLPTGKEAVVIRSIPAVNVLVDGLWQGRTPTENLELVPGSHTVTLVNDGAGIRREFQLTLEEGKPYERTFKFFGRLSVDVGRPCRVWAGNVDMGMAPFADQRIPAGMHRIRLEAEGVRPVVENVRIAVDWESRITGTLDNPVVEQPEY